MCEHSNECRCLRYIPQDNPGQGPRLCRDCEHWESLHPVPEAPKGPVANIFSRLNSQLDKVHKKEAASDDEARREASSGFRKASEARGGRGGITRFEKVGLAVT